MMTVLKLFSIDVGGPCLSAVNRLDTMISVQEVRNPATRGSCVSIATARLNNCCARYWFSLQLFGCVFGKVLLKKNSKKIRHHLDA